MDSREARTPVAWMPGVDRLNIEEAVRQSAHAAALGIPAIAPFPFVEKSLRDADRLGGAQRPQPDVPRGQGDQGRGAADRHHLRRGARPLHLAWP